MTEIGAFNWNNISNAILQKNGLIPPLNSQRDSSYFVTSSSEFNSDYACHFAFNGKGDLRWATTTNDVINAWIQIQLPSPRIFNVLILQSRRDNYFNQAPTSFSILASFDNSLFYVLGSFEASWTKGETKKIFFDNKIPFVYYKIKTLSSASGIHIALGLINFDYLE